MSGGSGGLHLNHLVYVLGTWCESSLISEAEDCEHTWNVSTALTGLNKNWSHVSDNLISIMKLPLVGVG